MRLRPILFAAVALSLLGERSAPAQQPGGTLRAFRSKQEFQAFHAQLLREYERRMKRSPPPPPVLAPPPPPPAVMAPPAPGEVVQREHLVVTQAGAESVTNVQSAGVDEGGIVKTHGDHLVILRRGRIFTVRIGDGGLTPVSAVNAFGPGIDPQGAWYDELLVADSLVAVIGYSYQRGGTEVGMFRIGRDGRLEHRATYQLRSGDYYSSRNYASRLVAGKLVFYAPIPFEPESGDPFASFPAFRRWGAADTTFRTTASITRVYRPAGRVSVDDELMMHTVTVCDPSGAEMSCESTALFGPEGREFYVSPRSVYVWATQEPAWDADDDAPERSVLYRMPLNGTAPSAVRVNGYPEDQFSFLESGDHLHVLVRGDEGRRAIPPLSLLRLPIRQFGDGSRYAPAAAYRPLRKPEEPGSLQNRYVGDWLLYGNGGGSWGAARPGGSAAYAVRWAAADSAARLALPHGVDRIEAMGTGAVVVGSDGRDLHFSGVRLGARAELADRYTRTGASQGETRSHGFFYRPDGAEAGVLGLPIRGPGRPGFDQLRNGSASVLFLRNRAFRFTELGDLAARPATADDGCLVSCVDWYGNARPLFLRGRIFALMGYELVEGAEDGGRIRETRRVSFAPPPAQVAGVWEYDETIGAEGDRYHCRSTGTYTFTQTGSELGVQYQQTGECTAGGRKVDNSGRGSGKGTFTGATLNLDLGTCRPTARLLETDRMVGTFYCPARLPDGTQINAAGRWTARRR